MNLQTKLANAIVGYLNARKGDRLAGVTIAAAHKPDALTMPFLSVWVPTAPTHPDFIGIQGAYLPQLCTVEFLMKSPMKADFETTVALWASELRDILAAGAAAPTTATEDFLQLVTDLNPEGEQHPETGLYITTVALDEESHGNAQDVRLYHMQLSIVAQAIDPD